MQIKEKPATGKSRIVLLGIVIIMTMASVLLCMNDSFWLDEIFSINHAQTDIVSIIRWTAQDVHPPLYYILLRGIVLLAGVHPAAMKLLSVAAFFLILLAGAWILNEERGMRPALFFAGVVFCIPNMLYYSVEVRMYTWAMLFVVLSSLLTYRLMKAEEKKYWILLALAVLCAAYTHYYALLAAGLNMLLAGIWGALNKDKGYLRHWLLAAAGITAGYLPWLPVLYRQAFESNAASWIKLENVGDYIMELVRLHTPFLKNGVLYVLLLYLIIMAVGSRKLEKWERLWAWGNAAVFFIVFLLCYIVSLVKAPIIVTRYLMIAFILLPLSLSIYSRYIPKSLFTLILIFFLYAGIFEYGNAYEQQNADMEGSMELLAGTIGENDIIYTDISGFSMYLEYYADRDYDVYYMEHLDAGILDIKPGWIATTGNMEEPEWGRAEYAGEGRFKRLPFKLYHWRGSVGGAEQSVPSGNT